MKTILFILPVLLWLVFFVYLDLGQQRTSLNLYRGDTVEWGSGENQLVASINKVSEANAELRKYVITVKDTHGNQVLKKDIAIDWDMGGGGLVSFMQLDNDDDMELVVAKKGGLERDNYYLDFQGDQIQTKFLNSVGEEFSETISDWFLYNVPNPFSVGLFGLLTLGYYVFFFPIVWIFRKLND
ncbi:MAG: hypothetical protein HKP55_04330 [Gammaproteobacteria bacterium]|nr:hypothetical protein [Gammaproteobacteria bacterium]